MKDPPIKQSFLFLFFFICLLCINTCFPSGVQAGAIVDVGVVLDLDTWVGKMSQSCMSMALSDFYAARNYSTKLILHPRDSKKDVVGAAARGTLSLLLNLIFFDNTRTCGEGVHTSRKRAHTCRKETYTRGKGQHTYGLNLGDLGETRGSYATDHPLVLTSFFFFLSWLLLLMMNKEFIYRTLKTYAYLW